MDGARLDTRRFIDGFLEARVPGASPFSISVEPDEPDKPVNTEMAISHKNVGTGKKYIVPYRVDVGRPHRKEKSSW